MILADNGSPWYITGTSNRLLSDDALHTLGMIHRQRPSGRRHQLASKRLVSRVGSKPARAQQLSRDRCAHLVGSRLSQRVQPFVELGQAGEVLDGVVPCVSAQWRMRVTVRSSSPVSIMFLAIV